MFNTAQGEVLCDLLHARNWSEALAEHGHGLLAAFADKSIQESEYDETADDFLRVLHRFVRQADLSSGPATSDEYHASLGLTTLDEPMNPARHGRFDVSGGTDELVGAIDESSNPGAAWLDVFALASMQTIADILVAKNHETVTTDHGKITPDQLMTIRILSVRFGGFMGTSLGRDLIESVGMAVEEMGESGQNVMW